MTNSNNKQFEVGIIGAGAITTTLHLPLLSAMKNTKPKFIADLFEPKELGKLYKINSYKIDNLTNLPDCDIILIATPVGVRNEYINEFSKRGIPIFTEKPFAIDIDTHEQFLSNSKLLGCNYMKIWYNTSKMFEKIIMNNTFGEIKKIIVNEGGIVGKTNRGPETYQSNKKLSGGGVIMESSCHTLSVFSSIFENLSVEKSEIIWVDELDVDAKIKFNVISKSNFPLEYRITLIHPILNETKIYFENFYISFDHTSPSSPFLIYQLDGEKIFELQNDCNYANSSHQAYYLTWQNFIETIKNKNEINTKELTSFQTTKLISEIFRISEQQ